MVCLQGLILGPFFCNLYINETDYLKVFAVINDAADCLTLQTALLEPHKCSANYLRLNLSKCLFHLRHTDNIVENKDTKNVPVTPCYLVAFDEKLSFVFDDSNNFVNNSPLYTIV